MHAEIFAKRLKLMRKRRKISANVLSQLCGLSPSVVSKYERGEIMPTLGVLVELAEFFDCSLDYLCGLSDIP